MRAVSLPHFRPGLPVQAFALVLALLIVLVIAIALDVVAGGASVAVVKLPGFPFRW